MNVQYVWHSPESLLQSRDSKTHVQHETSLQTESFRIGSTFKLGIQLIGVFSIYNYIFCSNIFDFSKIPQGLILIETNICFTIFCESFHLQAQSPTTFQLIMDSILTLSHRTWWYSLYPWHSLSPKLWLLQKKGKSKWNPSDAGHCEGVWCIVVLSINLQF